MGNANGYHKPPNTYVYLVDDKVMCCNDDEFAKGYLAVDDPYRKCLWWDDTTAFLNRQIVRSRNYGEEYYGRYSYIITLVDGSKLTQFFDTKSDYDQMVDKIENWINMEGSEPWLDIKSEKIKFMTWYDSQMKFEYVLNNGEKKSIICNNQNDYNIIKNTLSI